MFFRFAKFQIILLSILFFGLVFGGPVFAEYPDKPVTIIVGRGAGGSTDTIARTFAPYFSKHLGAPVVVKNIRGAGGQVAIRELIKAEPDGYTLILGVFPADVTRQIRRDPGYDVRDLDFVYAVAGGDANGLMVGYDSPYKTLDDFIKAAEKTPMTFSGTTPGGNSWLLMLFLQQAVNFKDISYVTFDSGNAATMAIVGGHVDAGVASTVNFPDLVREKKIRVLAVGSTKRLDSLPNAPTFAELGFPKVKTVTRQILMGPKGLPEDRVKVLAEAAAKAVKDPEFVERTKKQGFSLDPMGPDESHEEIVGTYQEIFDVLKKTGNLTRE